MGRGSSQDARPSAWRRLAAFALDYLLIFAYLTVLAGLGSFLTFGPVGAEWTAIMSDPIRADLVAFAVAILPVGLYFAISEASPRASTWGKRRLGLALVGPEGEGVKLPRSLMRTGLKLLPWQLAHTAMFHIPGFPLNPGEPPIWSPIVLILAWALVAIYVVGLSRLRGGRPLYDRLAGTRVILRS